MRPDVDSPPTLEWVDDHVRVIDQTLLPAELRIVELRTVAEVIDAIERLAIRGAPAIGACGAFGVVVAIDESMRDQWLACMAEAMDLCGIEGDVRSFLDARFAHVANFLRNSD